MTRQFGAECDLFSLGMLLLRALLVNGNQGEAAVSRHCRLVADDLGHGTNPGEPADGAGSVLGKLGHRIATDPLLNSRNLAYAPRDDAESGVPPDLWRRTVAMGFRLIMRIPGFSYTGSGARAGGDIDPAAVEQVVRDVCALRTDVRHALLSWQPPPEREIRAVLRDLIDDPDWLDAVLGQAAAPTAPPPGPPPSLETTVPEAGEDPVPAPGGTDVPEETVILRPGVATSAMAAEAAVHSPMDEPSAAGSKTKDSFEETVILKSPRQLFPDAGTEGASPAQGKSTAGSKEGPTPFQSPPTPSAGVDLESTVILKRGGTHPDIHGRSRPGVEPAEIAGPPVQGEEEPPAEATDFEKTIILRPRQKSSEEDQ